LDEVAGMKEQVKVQVEDHADLITACEWSSRQLGGTRMRSESQKRAAIIQA
jgi:hypothetical protein